MAYVDIFVILDDAQIQKTGGSWSNRALIGNKAPARWLTAPLDNESKKTGDLRDVRYANSPWREKAHRTLVQEYQKAPFYINEQDYCFELLNLQTNNLVEFNSEIIRSFAQKFLPNPPQIVNSSSLGITSTGTERLVDICTALEGGQYVFGGGAQNYQEDQLFEKANISLRPLSYTMPEEFKPAGESQGLSIIDSIFRIGPDSITEHLQSWKV